MKSFMLLVYFLVASTALGHTVHICYDGQDFCIKSVYQSGNLKIYIDQERVGEQKISDMQTSLWRKGLNTAFAVGATSKAEMNAERASGVPTIHTNWQTLEQLNMTYDEAVAVVKCSFESTLCVGTLALAAYAPPAWAGAIAACGTALIDCTDMIKKLEEYERRVAKAMNEIKKEAKKQHPEARQPTSSSPASEPDAPTEVSGNPVDLECRRFPAHEITSSDGDRWFYEAEVICKTEW